MLEHHEATQLGGKIEKESQYCFLMAGIGMDGQGRYVRMLDTRGRMHYFYNEEAWSDFKAQHGWAEIKDWRPAWFQESAE